MTAQRERLRSRRWRLGHSTWMLWGILTFGLLWTVGFGYIGLKAKRRSWIVIAGVLLLYTVLYFIVTPLVVMPGADGDPTPLSTTISLVFLGVWIGGFVFALFANRGWLVWLAEHQEETWYESAAGVPAAPTSAEPAAVAAAIDGALAAPPTVPPTGSAPAPAMPAPAAPAP